MALPPYLEHFTDRQDQIAAFNSLWPGDGRWILAFSGLSGNGKTTLVNWLIEARCKGSGLAWEKVDFANSPPLEAVPRALASLAGSSALARFDLAAKCAWQRYDQAIESISLAHAARPYSIRLDQVASEGGIVFSSPPNIHTHANEEFQVAHSLLQDCLRGELIRAALGVFSALGARPAVLFLDTYERFANANPPDTIDRLWRLIKDAASCAPGLRVVVSGREGLPYPPYSDVTQWLQLTDFTKRECEDFLSSYGMSDAALRREAYDLFRGHPLTTRMIGEAFADACHAGRPVQHEDLQQATLARSYNEWLYNLVIQNLPQLLQRPAQYGPILRRFNQVTLGKALGQSLEDTVFHALVTRAFIRPLGPGLYVFHEIIRRVQVEYLSGATDPEAANVYQRAILDAQARLESGDTSAKRDILYYRCRSDPATWFDEWLKEVDRAALVFDHLWWAELLDVMQVSAVKQQLRNLQHAIIAHRRGYWHFCHDELDDALAAYARARALYQAAQDFLGAANVLKAQGDTWVLLGRIDRAMNQYDEALTLFRRVEDCLGEANVLKAKGDALAWDRDNQQRDKVSQLYEMALAIFRQVGDQVGAAEVLKTQANMLMAQADLLSYQKQTDEALRSYEQALGLFEQIGDQLGQAKAILSRADVLDQIGLIERALAAYEQSLQLYRAVGKDSSVALSLRGLGRFHLRQGNMAQARVAFEQALAVLTARGLMDMAGTVQKDLDVIIDKQLGNMQPAKEQFHD